MSDTGHGIPADIQRHLFEPFFTTKPSDQGTGLGLSIVYGIVKSLGGAIEVQSEVGRRRDVYDLSAAGGRSVRSVRLQPDQFVSMLALHFHDEREEQFSRFDDGLMSNARRHHQHITGRDFLRFPTHVSRSANLAVTRVLRVLDAAAIEDCGFSTLNDEDVRPVLVKLSRTASIAPQDLELVIAKV